MSTLTLIGDAEVGGIVTTKAKSDSGVQSNATNNTWYTIKSISAEGPSLFVFGAYLTQRTASAYAIIGVDTANGVPLILSQGSGPSGNIEFRTESNYNIQVRFVDNGVTSDIIWNYLRIG